MAQDDPRWTVREPRLYGSAPIAIYPTESEARDYAERYGKERIEGYAGLKIHKDGKKFFSLSFRPKHQKRTSEEPLKRDRDDRDPISF